MTEPCTNKDSAARLFEAAEAAAEFMLRNQVTDRLDANKGRTLCEYSARTGRRSLTTSWQTGGVCMSLLAMYKRTGEQKYLEAAELAGHYIMSLQVMDSRTEKYYGAIRECTPQSLEFCPRDATTAAWALVWLFEATRNAEYLDRAIRFAEWHLKYGMCQGWPKWAVFMDGKFTDYYALGSFQSGTGLFYHDLFLRTGDTRYIESGLKPIADLYIRDFLRADGSVILERRIFSNLESDRRASGVEVDIHNYNDDFGAQMLQAAADLFHDESYRSSAVRFAEHLSRSQTADGAFLNGTREIQSAVPIAFMYFDELGKRTAPGLLPARDRTLKKLLSMQILDTDDPRLHGAFEGLPDGDVESDPRRSTNMRTTMYALIALLKAEGKAHDFWLGGSRNKGFTDPLDRLAEHPYAFKW